ncbi:MAG: helix-turn-helix domain-containing protein [Bacilli bacterium]
MNQQNIIGEKLRQLRTKKGISQAELAKAIFVNNTTISNWEKGTRQIHINSLKLICVYFEVPLDYFNDKDSLDKIEQKKLPLKPIIAASASVALAVSVGVVLLGGRSGLINDACYGETNCYLINDPSIITELESRNIAGGLMTNIELNKVYELLNEYITPLNYGVVDLVREVVAESENAALNEQYAETRNNIQKILQSTQLIIDNQHYLNLININTENLQLFIVNETKYVIYKTSSSTFQYEIYGKVVIDIRIDLDLDAIFINDQRLFRDAEAYVNEIYENQLVVGRRYLMQDENNHIYITMINDSVHDFEMKVLNPVEETYHYLALFNNPEANLSNILFGVTYYQDESRTWGYGYDYASRVTLEGLIEAMRNTSLITRIGSGQGNNFDVNFNFSESEAYFALLDEYESFLNQVVATFGNTL